MQGIGFFIIGIVLIIFLSFQSEEGGLFRSALPTQSGSTSEEQTSRNTNEVITTAEPQNTLSERDAERKIQKLYDELDSLTENLRDLKLREPASPYRGSVTLSAGNARNTDPSREYVVLRAANSNSGPVNISDWYLESYVSERRAAIPQGARLLGAFRSFKDQDVLLLPGERAYLLTTETPLNVSFHENACSGYLAHEADFYPSLKRSCPYPKEELKDFSNVPLDDDVCYDYVESLGVCSTVSEKDIDEIDDLSGTCRVFLENSLNYNGCVDNHGGDPLFDDVGDWRIYLDRRGELWRKKREIIRLMDERDRVIDVIEY